MASGIMAALIPRFLEWRVLPNLVSLHLDGIGADPRTGKHPIRSIGRAMKKYNQLPAIQELVFINCPVLKEDVKKLATALKKGHAAQLRVLSWDNSRDGSPEPSANLLLKALARGARPRPRVEALTFAEGWNVVGKTPLVKLRPALKACPGLRKLTFDCSRRPVPELFDLAHAIAMGDAPHLEYVCLRMPDVSSTDPPQQAIEFLTNAATSKVPPIRLEVKIG